MIPKVIHYCWFGKESLPLFAKKCVASWKKYCPDYEIKSWNESNFDVNCHPFVRAAYEAKKWAFVADYARLKIIYEQGGIYLDTDVRLLKSLDPLLTEKCYFGVQQRDLEINTGLGFGAEPQDPAVKRMLDEYDSVTFSEQNIKALTCPHFNMSAGEAMGYRYSDCIVQLPCMTVYSPEYFDPIPAGDYPDLLSEKSFSVHLSGMSWMSGKQRIRRQLICLTGVKTLQRIKRVHRKFMKKTS